MALRNLAHRNFRICCVVIFCAYGVLYANSISLPALLQSLFGYNATASGLVLSPSGIFAVVMLVVVGAMLSRGIDARYLMAGGLLTMALGSYWMAKLYLDVSPWQVVWPRVVVVAGLSMLFAPLNVAVHLSTEGNPRRRRWLARSAAQRRRQRGNFSRSDYSGTARAVSYSAAERNPRYAEPCRQQSVDAGPTGFLQHNGDAVLSHQMAVGALDQSLAQQASSLAYFDVFSGQAPWLILAGVCLAHASLGSGEGGSHRWRVASSRSLSAEAPDHG